MLKEKFTISPYYELHNNEVSGQPQYTLHHKTQADILVVNPVIYTFLNLFKTPASLEDAITFFVKETKSSIKEVKPILLSFFDSMLERAILMHEEDYNCLTIRPTMPNAEGQMWFDYHLIKQLSTDPPVDIYLAQKENGNRYIVKRVLFAPDYPIKYVQKELKNFQREFNFLKILRGCKGICQLIENNTEHNYAAIEYFEGYSLRKRIEDIEPSLTITEKCHIYTQILETMAFIHEKGILHGDFHYSNILLNDDLIVKIIDFDLALHITEREKKGIVRGGVKDFLPPERIDTNAFEIFNDPPDYQAEVFQIGVIGYFLFFESLPFKGNTWTELAHAITHQELKFDTAELPQPIALFLKKTLHKVPKLRFDSAIDMCQEWLLLTTEMKS